MKNDAKHTPAAAILLATSALTGCAHAAPPSTPRPPEAAHPDSAQRFDVHDFDMFAGEWDLANRRLAHRGVGSHEWVEFPATSRTTIYMGGVVNVDQIDFPALGFSGVTVRTFDLKAQRWSIYWVNSKIGILDTPVVGGFVGDRGEFYGVDHDNGRPIKVRFVWTKLGPDSARWEQSFDYGDGKWELNWMNVLTRRR